MLRVKLCCKESCERLSTKTESGGAILSKGKKRNLKEPRRNEQVHSTTSKEKWKELARKKRIWSYFGEKPSPGSRRYAKFAGLKEKKRTGSTTTRDREEPLRKEKKGGKSQPASFPKEE